MQRSFKTFFEAVQVDALLNGTMNYRYRDVPCLKNPFDIAIYLRLLHDARPATLIEIGTKEGGSALLFRDFGRVLGLSMDVVSIDLQPPRRRFDGVTFVQGDVRDLESAFAVNGIDGLPRPWLVVEDSSHQAADCLAALHFFADRLRPSEWLVIEDGSLVDFGMSERYDGGPNKAIGEFFAIRPDVFEVGVEYCDMFGPNATFNPNGYLKRRPAVP